MDAETRARYEAWMFKRILRRVIIPGLLLFVLLIALIMGLRSCGSDDEAPEQTPEETVCTTEEDEACEEALEPDDAESRPASSRQPTYEDFDFTTYNEDTMIEIGSEYLNSYVILVNKAFRLPENYEPADLVVPNVLAVWGAENVLRMRESAARALEALFEAAYEDEGLELWVVSGYRSFEDQVTRHQYFVDTHGTQAAETMSARPGHSEHQTGLAMDVAAASVGALLTEEFSNAPEGVWLRENAHRFGFIIRYPYSRRNLTGIGYEPWHIRYVGVDAATHIFEHDLVLEQYVFPVPRWEQP